MGETEFWDEFIVPGDKGGSGKIIFEPSKENGIIKVRNWEKLLLIVIKKPIIKTLPLQWNNLN